MWKSTYRLDWAECPPDRRGCCARKVLAAERDFCEQKGQLTEELEARGQVVIFLPKFHCELNPIESYWCQAKWYCRENCNYTFKGLRDTVPMALASVKNSTILGFWKKVLRTIDAYKAAIIYGTEEFKNRVYRSHRRVEDKSKWSANSGRDMIYLAVNKQKLNQNN